MSSKEYYMIEKQTIQMDPLQTNGLILDIGGGGEGIVGRLHGRQVVAIDIRIEELAETKNESLRIVMDATDLKFLPSSFDVTTSFFSLMYIKNDCHLKVFKEIHEVLKSEGRFYIWDVRIPSKQLDKPVFAVPLEIVLPNEKVETGYGVGWDQKEQDLQYFKELAQRTGFELIDEWSRDKIFYMELVKRAGNRSSDTA
jgi:SAM-dependent methyltransferase